MPSVNVYIREKPYSRLLRECGNDPKKAKQKIATMVHEKYA